MFIAVLKFVINEFDGNFYTNKIVQKVVEKEKGLIRPHTDHGR